MKDDRRLDSWLEEHLVCPRDKRALSFSEDTFSCSRGHTYPLVDGVPIMLLREIDLDLGFGGRTLDEIITFGSTPDAEVSVGSRTIVDPFVQAKVAGTCGRMYRSLVGNLPSYPIPAMRLPPSDGARLLDIGCGWGRWSIAAAGKGYRPVGIDASFEAIRAARRVTHQLGASAVYVVADARFLPFSDASFDNVFSYSFLQHLSKKDVRVSLREIGRVLSPGGTSLIEMANAIGLWNAVQQVRRGFRDPGGFGVRYWHPVELRREFSALIGPSSLSVDSYFFINGQPSDRDLLPRRYRLMISISEILRKLSERAEFMKVVADSLYVHSTRAEIGQRSLST